MVKIVLIFGENQNVSLFFFVFSPSRISPQVFVQEVLFRYFYEKELLIEIFAEMNGQKIKLRTESDHYFLYYLYLMAQRRSRGKRKIQKLLITFSTL